MDQRQKQNVSRIRESFEKSPERNRIQGPEAVPSDMNFRRQDTI